MIVYLFLDISDVTKLSPILISYAVGSMGSLSHLSNLYKKYVCLNSFSRSLLHFFSFCLFYYNFYTIREVTQKLRLICLNFERLSVYFFQSDYRCLASPGKLERLKVSELQQEPKFLSSYCKN